MIVAIAALLFWRANFSEKEELVSIDAEQDLPVPPVVQEKAAVETAEKPAQIQSDEPAQSQLIKKRKVPFTSQAPLGNWDDERLQNGCEEASILMAMKWIQNKTFSSPAEAQQEIFELAKFEEKTFGNHVDTSVEEVGEIFSQYYGYENFTVSREPTLDVLKSELEKGNIILVPAFGRALKNPNYTLPGPITHMLVLVGYDAKTKEFITNDPGTKRGEGYRYDENILFDAMWAYPAGKNHPESPKSTAQKAMLIVRQN